MLSNQEVCFLIDLFTNLRITLASTLRMVAKKNLFGLLIYLCWAHLVIGLIMEQASRSAGPMRGSISSLNENLRPWNALCRRNRIARKRATDRKTMMICEREVEMNLN